ncbi:MAG: neutral/alkaline non-lysosomal ceramidase N-terminal domain-containing protein [Bacteroidetes bacterium]|nr:neutral/alkaline non-lysosomal ceramidase N-terminal domain-containing protein [Bacteroidota bacterium]
MKKKLVFSIMIIVLGFIPRLSKAQNSESSRDLIRLGVSQVNITPEQPVIMSGYGARITPSTGVHDSLFASALFFTGEKNRALIITADMIGFSDAFVDEIKKNIYEKTGLPGDHVMIIATHNHGGPAIHVYEDTLPQGNEDYIKSLKEKLVALAANAMKNPVLFQMGVGRGICKLNISRRAVFADGGVGLGRNQDAPCDHELDLIKFVDLQDNLLAVLLNWPCHGTVSGQDNYKITGDWPAAAARYIKKLTGKNIIVAVTAGASADINPIYGPGVDFNEVETVGYHVGNEAWKTLTNTKTFAVRSLGIVNSKLTFPAKKPWKGRFPQTSYISGSDVAIRLTALKLGKLVLCGISGELMTEMGMQIKKESRGSSTVIITHCNGASGYICTDKAFNEGGYEVMVSELMPGVEKPLVKKCIDMVHSFLTSPDK